MNRSKRIALLTAAALSAVLSAGSAWAQADDYPSRPVRVIVPFATGGSTDLLGRLTANKLSERLNQRFIVENRTGAGGRLGTEATVRSDPDGYTLLFHTGALAVEPSVKKKTPYDVRKDLIPISLALSGPFYLVVNPAVPARNITELVAYAKANPGKLNFGSPGIGSSIHLASEMFKSAAGIDIVHVPYKGNSPALAGLIAGDIQFMLDLLPTSKPMIDAGKVRVLGVSTMRRSSDMPDLPTAHESGVRDYESAVWMGLLAPAGTPPAIINKIAGAMQAILKAPDVQAQLRSQGFDAIGSTPAEFSRFLNEEIDRYAKVIREARLDID